LSDAIGDIDNGAAAMRRVAAVSDPIPNHPRACQPRRLRKAAEHPHGAIAGSETRQQQYRLVRSARGRQSSRQVEHRTREVRAQIALAQ
jgi:hypothetical protein